jgi:UDP-2,3-diacylglucosamine pyrophosphatase LpxH
MPDSQYRHRIAVCLKREMSALPPGCCRAHGASLFRRAVTEGHLMNRLSFLREEGGLCHWRFVDDGAPLGKTERSERKRIHSLVISDVHFGSSVCKARPLHATLNTFWITENLIINGDAFQGSDLKRVSGAQQKVLERIRKLGDPDRHLNDIWVRGNHDEDVFELFSAFFGLTVLNEYVWECGGKRYLAIHGDQWDRFISDRPGATQVAIWFGELFQRIDPHNRHIIRFLSRSLGHWRREHDRVAMGAARYGRSKGIDFVMCGHTHGAMRRQLDGIEYLNSGSWTEDPCSFITVTEEGPCLNFVQLS